MRWGEGKGVLMGVGGVGGRERSIDEREAFGVLTLCETPVHEHLDV